jgi:autotransporter-associated beta strand protein
VTSTITGANLSVNKLGTGTVTLSGASYSGGTLINAGALAGSTSGLQGYITNNGTVIFDQGTNGSYAGMLSGTGAVNKAGVGNVTFTTENTYSGGTVVNYGTLTLNASSGSAAKNTASVTVFSGATLLISASEQVTNSAAVTLSGGTISRGSGVSETFGALNLTANSFLNYGSVSESQFIQFGSLSMGEYTLGVTGFANLNQLSYSATSLANGASKLSSFTFDNSYTTSFLGGTFTITAIPETSAYVAALGLLVLMLWPLRHRLRGKVS